MEPIMEGAYERAYQACLADPESFWGQAAQKIDWYRPYERVLDASNPPLYRWFVGGELNTCHNAIDYHVENGRADQLAVIYDSPVTGTKRKLTYRELREEVARFAGVLTSLGVTKGDRVVISIPMTLEALIPMYGAARVGAIHSGAFG